MVLPLVLPPFSPSPSERRANSQWLFEPARAPARGEASHFLSSLIFFFHFSLISYHRVSVSYHRSCVSYFFIQFPIIAFQFLAFFFQFPIIAFQFPINGRPDFPLFFNFLSTVIRFFHFFSISNHRVSISYQRSSCFCVFIQFPIIAHAFFPLFLNFLSSRFNFLSTVGPIFYFFSISNPRSSISCPPFRFPLPHFIISSLPLLSPPFLLSHTIIYSIVPVHFLQSQIPSPPQSQI